MKKTVFLTLTLATAALFANPVFAGHEDHVKDAQATHEEVVEPSGNMGNRKNMMQESIEKMRSQMDEINKTREPKERLKLLQAHNKSMRDSINMMREMMDDNMEGDRCDHERGGKMMGGKMEGDRCDHERGGKMMGGKMEGDRCDHERGGKMAGGRCDHEKCREAMSGNTAGDHCDHKNGKFSASQPGGSADTAPVAQSSLGQLVATKKVWLCPMHPEFTQDHPGVCPECGMDLIEAEQPAAAQSEESGRMKDDGMKGDECMSHGRTKGGDTKRHMRGMMEKRMDMMLILMEQIIEHNDAEISVLK